MTTIYRTQMQAIAEALNEAGPDGCVSVFGPRETAERLPTERSCNEPDDGPRIVYHVDVRPTHDARFACASCGEMSGEAPARRVFAS